eukprot:COSAG06_NODE_4947_length_3839_cov_5.234383_2_plen_69_part_00
MTPAWHVRGLLCGLSSFAALLSLSRADIIPDQQFSYDSFARLDLVFGTQHKAAEALLEECRAGTIDLP